MPFFSSWNWASILMALWGLVYVVALLVCGERVPATIGLGWMFAFCIILLVKPYGWNGRGDD